MGGSAVSHGMKLQAFGKGFRLHWTDVGEFRWEEEARECFCVRERCQGRGVLEKLVWEEQGRFGVVCGFLLGDGMSRFRTEQVVLNGEGIGAGRRRNSEPLYLTWSCSSEGVEEVCLSRAKLKARAGGLAERQRGIVRTWRVKSRGERRYLASRRGVVEVLRAGDFISRGSEREESSRRTGIQRR